MIRFLIAFLFMSLPMGVTGQESADDPDRAALMEAWRNYQALSSAGNYGESLEEARRVLELSLKVFPENDKQVAAATANYGENLLKVGNNDQSLKILKIALKRYEILYGKNSPELIRILIWMAEASVAPPKNRPRQSYLDRARKIASSNFDQSSVEYADKLIDIAWSSYFYPPSETTGDDLRRAYEIYKTKLGPTATITGQAAYGLGVYYTRLDEFDDAEPYLQEALEIFDPSDASLQQSHQRVRLVMWRMFEDQGRTDEATAQLVELGKVQEIYPDDNNGLPISRVAPVYPASALKAGISGHVDLAFTVDEEGRVINPEVVEYTGSEAFVPFAIRTVERFRYVPHVVDGKAVARDDATTRITFRIEN
ncbi:MAG: TonB family protein [Woeseiaceae bacterium]